MGIHSLCQSFFFLSLLFAVSLCSADDKTFEVVGTTECVDCNQNNLKTSQAFSGLHVSIDCKLKNGDTKRVGGGEVDKQGKFKVSLPQELKEECYAQLHSAAALPCPAHNALDASKIVLNSQTEAKTTFAPTKNLQFSAAFCSSKAFLARSLAIRIPIPKLPNRRIRLPPLPPFRPPRPRRRFPPPPPPPPRRRPPVPVYNQPKLPPN